MTPAEIDALLAQVRQRAANEDGFQRRMTRAIETIQQSVVTRENQSLCVGIAGLVMHMDDIAEGRWTA